jgi:phenylalanyl-tRNA synthetase beta chain
MQISLNWIRAFCRFETQETPLAIGARFSVHTAEVEHAAERGSSLRSIVAARVLSVKPHPNADRLTLVRIDAGQGSQPEVVCGAPNVREGLMVPYAPPGVKAGGREIREAKVRGVLSQGMLCSEKELEVSEEASGLWELSPDAPPGTPLSDLFPDLSDIILEIDNKSLTHRPDLWGHHGMAREFSAIYGAPLKPLEVDEGLATAKGKAAIRVSFSGKGVGGREGLCRRYCGLQIDGVRVAPSPAWLRHRLLMVGSRPINNIVDITNYILFELGQPLHAFDTTRVEGSEIRVRRAFSGEELRLLDQTEVKLETDDLVIADARSAVALAGIMGGSGSEVTDSTTSIFLESANFAPARIRRSSIRVGKRTDSSLRFEKSLDPENAKTGILRAAKMVLELCPGASVVGPLQDVGYEPAAAVEIGVSAGFINERLGAEIAPQAMKATLEVLGFQVSGDEGGEWKVRVPTWRATKDISIREDLVEEVGRIHGYGNIRPFAPQWTIEAPRFNEHRRLERAAKDFLTLHAGLSEVFTYSLVGASHCSFFGLDPEAHLKLKNPISEDMDRLRTEIVPIHLVKAQENQRYFKSFGFFELGRVYRKPERNRLAGLISFEGEKSAGNFYATKHIVLGLLQRLRLADVDVAAASAERPPEPWAHPTVYSRVLLKGKECGRFYRIHPAVEAKLELKGDIMAFDLDFDLLFESFESRRRKVHYQPPLRYPTVPFEVSVVAPSRTTVREIQEVIEKSAGKLLMSSQVFDIYEGEQCGVGKKSVSFRLVFGSPDRTLEGDEIKAMEEKVVGGLVAAGFPLR